MTSARSRNAAGFLFGESMFTIIYLLVWLHNGVAQPTTAFDTYGECYTQAAYLESASSYREVYYCAARAVRVR